MHKPIQFNQMNMFLHRTLLLSADISMRKSIYFLMKRTIPVRSSGLIEVGVYFFCPSHYKH